MMPHTTHSVGSSLGFGTDQETHHYILSSSVWEKKICNNISESVREKRNESKLKEKK